MRHKKDTISAREREIIELACQGLTDKEICRTLSLSLTTVRTYWSRAREKLGAVNRAQVVAEVGARNLSERLAASNLTRLVQANVGTWLLWPEKGVVVLDQCAAEMFGARDPQQITTVQQLLSSVSITDRHKLEDLLHCPRASMAIPGTNHRMAALNGSAPWIRTVVMGPCHDEERGAGWVLASMPMKDAFVGTQVRFAVI